MHRARPLALLAALSCGPGSPSPQTGDGTGASTTAAPDQTSTSSPTSTTDDPATTDGPPTTDDTTTADPVSTESTTGTDTGTVDTVDTDPNCPTVIETLVVDDATDPALLACLEAVTGDLTIGPSQQLNSLALLANLREVGGMLWITGNAALTDLSGLENLEHAGGLGVGHNDALVSMQGLEGVTEVGSYIVRANPELVSLSPLGGAVTFPFITTLEIHKNPKLTSLDDLAGMTMLGAGVPTLQISENDAMTDLGGLAACCSLTEPWLLIYNNPALETLVGLEPFTTLENLAIVGNHELVNLKGLSGIEQVTYLEIGAVCGYDHGYPKGNNKLAALDGLDALDVVDGWAAIVANPLLLTTDAEAFIADLSDPQPAYVEICENFGGDQCFMERPCPQ